MLSRRQFLGSLLAVAALPGRRRGIAGPLLRFGHRQANMVNEPGPAVFDLAKQIGGLSGVELQVFFKGTTLWEGGTLASYKRAARDAGLSIPSLAGIWAPGASILQPTAEEHIRKAVRAAESLGASTILAACFEQNCWNMDQPRSFEPVVNLLRKLSSTARDAGVTIALETSDSPADDRKFIDLVGSPNVAVYYDLDNVERYRHTGEAVPGVALLGTRIRQVHLKNGDRLLEQPGRVDWAKAVKALAAIGYSGWFVFETAHSSPQQCIKATTKNIEFVNSHFDA